MSVFSIYDYKNEAEKAEKKVLYVDFIRKKRLDMVAAYPHYKRPTYE